MDDNLKKLLFFQTKVHQKILEYFGTEGYDTIEDATTVNWQEVDRVITFIDGDSNTKVTWEYCVKQCLRGDAVLYYCRDKGDKFYAIFDIKNKVDEIS